MLAGPGSVAPPLLPLNPAPGQPRTRSAPAPYPNEEDGVQEGSVDEFGVYTVDIPGAGRCVGPPLWAVGAVVACVLVTWGVAFLCGNRGGGTGTGGSRCVQCGSGAVVRHCTLGWLRRVFAHVDGPNPNPDTLAQFAALMRRPRDAPTT